MVFLAGGTGDQGNHQRQQRQATRRGGGHRCDLRGRVRIRAGAAVRGDLESLLVEGHQLTVDFGQQQDAVIALFKGTGRDGRAWPGALSTRHERDGLFVALNFHAISGRRDDTKHLECGEIDARGVVHQVITALGFASPHARLGNADRARQARNGADLPGSQHAIAGAGACQFEFRISLGHLQPLQTRSATVERRLHGVGAEHGIAQNLWGAQLAQRMRRHLTDRVLVSEDDRALRVAYRQPHARGVDDGVGGQVAGHVAQQHHIVGGVVALVSGDRQRGHSRHGWVTRHDGEGSSVLGDHIACCIKQSAAQHVVASQYPAGVPRLCDGPVGADRKRSQGVATKGSNLGALTVLNGEHQIERCRETALVGSDESWDFAEKALADALDSSGLDWEYLPGEGAFYGPKIEFSLKDSLGRVWQCGTIQVDPNMPERLDAEFVNEQNERETPIMLHRAILGSFERFIGILIENYAGWMPVWLAPQQVAVMNITDKQADACENVVRELKNAGLRATSDLRNEKIGFKIREKTLERVPYMLVLGDKEVETGSVNVRTREGENLGVMSVAEFISLVQTAVSKKGRQTPKTDEE